MANILLFRAISRTISVTIYTVTGVLYNFTASLSQNTVLRVKFFIRREESLEIQSLPFILPAVRHPVA